jgi:hypothetical protein
MVVLSGPQDGNRLPPVPLRMGQHRSDRYDRGGQLPEGPRKPTDEGRYEMPGQLQPPNVKRAR